MFAPVVAGIAAAVIGFIWYHPRVFGAAWMRFSNITPETAERAKQTMMVRVLVALAASTLVAYVMSYFSLVRGVRDWIDALLLGFLAWIGFVAPALLGQVLWEQKPLRLYFINSAYWLVTLVVIALLLAYAQ